MQLMTPPFVCADCMDKNVDMLVELRSIYLHCADALLTNLQVLLKSPMLLESELQAITSQAGLMNETFNLHYESGKPGALKAAVDALCKGVEAAVRNGCEVHARSLTQRLTDSHQ